MKLRFLLITLISFYSFGQAGLTNALPTYTQDFSSLPTTGTPTWTDNATPIVGWYSTKNGLTYAVNNGSANANNVYSYGTTSAADRALGALSTATTHRFALRLRNDDLTQFVTSLSISFTGEQWRQNAASQTLVFEYQKGATALTTGTWTALTALDFVSPNIGVAGALDGNLVGNQTAKSSTLSIVLNPGEEVWLRWTKSGTNSHGLAIDNMNVTATYSSGCLPPINQPSALTTTNITNVGADFSWINAGGSTGTMVVINPTGSSTLPTSGTSYAPTTSWTTAGQIDTNNRVFYRGTGTAVTGIAGLTPGTQYTATIYAYNDPGSCYNITTPETFTFYTLANEPTAHAASFSCLTVSASQINLTFSAASTVGGNGYIILYRENAIPTGVPTDGAYHAPGTVFGDTTVLGQTSNTGTDTTFTATGLNGGTTYYFMLVPFSANLSIAQTLNYRVTPTIPISSGCITSVAPEINMRGVIGSNPTITDGDITPSGLDNTLFATVVVGNSQAKNFRIENTGNANLTINAGAITFVGGTAPTDFALSGIVLPAIIAPGTFLDFTITFSPTGGGTRNTTLTIANNDPNENPYDYVIQGNGTLVSLIDINVKGGTLSQSIPDNSIYPVGTNWTAFGVAIVGSTTVTRVFTIENLGTTDLTLTGVPLVAISGPHASMFTVTVLPSSTIAGGTTTTFSVMFNPTSPGAKNATITIANNDSDENPYNFNINGTAKGASNIYTYGNGNDVIKGATTTSLTNLTNFGGVATVTGVKQNTFVITNLSSVAVYISNLTISGVDAAMFTIVSPPTNNALSSGNSTSVTINFTPSTIGIKNATVTYSVWLNSGLSTPDTVDPIFTYAISGLGENYTACTNGAIQTLAQQDFEDVPASPVWSYGYTTDGVVNIAGGTYNNGSTPKNAFIGAKSFQFNSTANATIRTAVINLNAIDVSQYNNINLSLKVGAFRTGTTQGLDVNDLIQIDSSIDGGVNWSTESVLRAYSNSRWDLAATGVFNAYYTGTNNGATIDTRNGGAELANGISTYNVKNLPASSNLLLRITLVIDRIDEIWAIDNIKIEGQIPVSTTWNGTTWLSGAPTTTTKAIIDGYYNTGTHGNIETCECLIKSTRTVDVSANSYLEIQSNLTNNGTLNIANNGSLIQVNDSAINTGIANNITRTTTPYEKYDYTYWSSPVDASVVSSTFAGWRTDMAFTLNTANYQDITTVATGLPPSDTFDDDQNDWALATSDTMIPGKGYIVMASTAGTFPTTASVTFSGKINNGIINLPMALSQNNAANDDDYNLIGNPYPSAISATEFINRNLANISGNLYFWTHVGDVQPVATNPGPQAFNYNSDDYALFNLSGGTRTALTAGATVVPAGFIASGQGFEVEAENPVNLVFDNLMRNKTYSNSQFFRPTLTQTEAERDRIWLNFENADGMFSQQLLGYFDNTTLSYDKAYDCLNDNPTSFLSFYSFIEGQKAKIQARPSFNVNDIVPLGYFSAVSGNSTISIENPQGQLNSTSTNIYLQDNYLNIIHDLKQASYSFYTDYGTFNDRFVLMFQNPLNNPEFEQNIQNVIVSSNPNEVSVKSINKEIQSVILYDILGREVANRNNINKNEIIFNNLNISNQALIVKVKLENGQVVSRKVVL